jgi:hypothetical protein
MPLNNSIMHIPSSRIFYQFIMVSNPNGSLPSSMNNCVFGDNKVYHVWWMWWLVDAYNFDNIPNCGMRYNVGYWMKNVLLPIDITNSPLGGYHGCYFPITQNHGQILKIQPTYIVDLCDFVGCPLTNLIGNKVLWLFLVYHLG